MFHKLLHSAIFMAIKIFLRTQLYQQQKQLIIVYCLKSTNNYCLIIIVDKKI